MRPNEPTSPPARSEAAGTERPAQRASDEELAELEALYRERKAAAFENVHEADVAFMTGMISHHAQALVMSHLAPTHGASPPIRVLTGRIINAQRDEIRVMSQWLADRGRHVPVVEFEGIVLKIDGEEHSMHMSGHMPGMLSRAQLEQLDAARGTEFDRLFLEFMIQHHNGAVSMVHELFATDGAGEDDATFKLASDIQVDQITEVARMELMLKEMTDGGDPGTSNTGLTP